MDKKTVIIVVLVAIVSLGLGFWTGYDYRTKEIEDAFTDAFGVENNEDEEAELESSDFVLYEIGDTIEYATQTMRVNSARSSDTFTEEYRSPEIASENSKFVIIDMTVTNTLDSSFGFEPYVLIDENDRMYSSSDRLNSIQDGLMYETLSPDVPKTAKVVYEVPEDATSLKLGGRKGNDPDIHAVAIEVN